MTARPYRPDGYDAFRPLSGDLTPPADATSPQDAYRLSRRAWALDEGRPYPEDGGGYAGRSRTRQP